MDGGMNKSLPPVFLVFSGYNPRAVIALFSSLRSAVESLVASSALSPEARNLYLSHFADRLRALAQ